MALTKTQVSELYVSIFNRASEKSGSQNWLNSGYNTDATTMANAMLATDAAKTYFGTSLDSDAAFVEHIYANTLNKGGATVDAAGKAGWVEFLATGKSRGEMVAKMIEAIKEYQVGGAKYATADQATKDAAQQFDNRVKVSDYTADTLETIAVSEIDSKLSFSSALTVTAKPATIDSAKATIDATNPANVGKTFTLTTGTDVLIGTAKNDTFTGTTTTYANADRVVDSSSTDNDTYTLSINANATPDVIGVENVNVTTEATAPVTVTAGSMSGVKTLTVTPGNVTVAGSTIQGSKTVSIDKLSSAKVEKVVIGDGATGQVTVDMTQTTATDSKAGVAIDALTATGNITITGATTLNADNAADTAGEKVIVKAIVGANAAENAKAVTVNAAKAVDVEISNNGASKFTGAITVNAALAKEVNVDNAEGGLTLNAAKAADSASTGIVVAGIDDSGAVITTGSYGTKTAGTISKQGTISVDGTTGTSDVATISAAGYVKVTSNLTQQVETLNLSANAAAVEYEIVGAATTYNLSGANDVVLTGNESSFDGKTVTDTTTAGTTAVKITTLDDSDLSKVATDKIIVASNVASKTLTVANNANIELATDIATAFSVAGKNASSTVNLVVGDDTNASGAAITIETGTLTAATNITTVNLDATVGKFTATATTLTNDNAAGTGATLNITGSKDVSLGTVTAKEVNAGSSTGKITMTANGANTSKTITTGTGADHITLNQALKFTVDAGNGDNTVVITAADTASSIATGSGADTVTIGTTNSVVVVTGAGDDTVNFNADSDSIIIMGDGTSDKIIFSAAHDLTDNANFAVTGVEIVDVAAAGATSVKITAAAFALDNTFKLIGTAAGTDDVLTVVNKSATAGAVIDASGVTFNSTQDAFLSLQGAALLADTITGSAKNDTIIASSGADIINGGEGTDTFNAAALAATDIEGAGTGTSNGVVINLGTTAITNTSILAGTTKFTANTITSVEAGKTAYLFDAAATTNSAVQQTLTSIENVVGTSGNDYIVGSANDNVITGGAGADYLTGGLGADIFKFTAGDSLVAKSDKITDFNTGNVKDVIDHSVTLSLGGNTAAATAGNASISAGGKATFDATDNTLEKMITAVAADLNGANANTAGKVAFFENGGNTYVFITDSDDSTTTGDDLIQLTGVTGLTAITVDGSGDITIA